MTHKSILLGGALTVALAGAAFAQADTQNSPAQNSQTQPAHHVRHHARHHTGTAYLHQSSPAERGATRDLNLQQASMVQSAGPQTAPQPMNNTAPPTRYPGTTYNIGTTPSGGGPADNTHVVPH